MKFGTVLNILFYLQLTLSTNIVVMRFLTYVVTRYNLLLKI